MIIFVDPDEYDQRLANKKKGPVPEPRPGTQAGRTMSRAGRRNIKTDAMKTALGFYSRGPKNNDMTE